MVHWDYRVVETGSDDEEVDYAICEVSYDENGEPKRCETATAVITVVRDGHITPEGELRSQLTLMEAALRRNVLRPANGKLVDTGSPLTSRGPE